MQQRFAYRAKAEATLPAGTEELQLAVDGDNGEMTTVGYGTRRFYELMKAW